MSDKIALKVEHLTKIYKLYDTPMDRLKESLHPLRRKFHKDFYALNDVSFEIKKGETVGIIGKNGSGKSTLLKILTGVLTPTSGNVHVYGKVSALLELGAGFNPELTGIENVYFNGTLSGYTREEMDARMDDILAFADIGDFVHQSVKMYSSGMFVRLAFAVAINVEPDILIVDEALSVGDTVFQAKCYDKINDIIAKGATLLLVTHSTQVFQSICSRGILLNSGTMLMEGKPDDVSLTYYKMQRQDLCNENQNNRCVKTNNNVLIRDPDLDSDSPSEELRFGNNKAIISDYFVIDYKGTKTTSLLSGTKFSIIIVVSFSKDVMCPAVGAMIRSKEGQNLLGVHSYHERHIDFGSKKSGDVLKVELSTEMLLNPGKYTLSIGVANQFTEQDYESLDSRNNVCEIEVYGKTIAYGLIHNNGEVREI